MSPWRMMNEWDVPSVELWNLTYRYAHKLAKKGEYIPDIAFAGGITFEDQIFKALAIGAPYVKAIGMARSVVAAAMVGKTIGKRYAEIPPGAIGVYSYFARLSQGLRQLMAGNRKFNLSYITRDDIASLTKEAADISGIPYVLDCDKDEVE